MCGYQEFLHDGRLGQRGHLMRVMRAINGMVGAYSSTSAGQLAARRGSVRESCTDKTGTKSV